MRAKVQQSCETTKFYSLSAPHLPIFHYLCAAKHLKSLIIMLVKGISTIALLICSNIFMTLAWYGHIAFKSQLQRYGIVAIILISWGIALFEYCFQVPANRIGSAELGGPFTLWQLKVIQEVISLVVFTLFAVLFVKGDPLRWNHLAGFACLVLAVYFIFRK